MYVRPRYLSEFLNRLGVGRLKPSLRWAAVHLKMTGLKSKAKTLALGPLHEHEFAHEYLFAF
jgi:hypothetical protein